MQPQFKIKIQSSQQGLYLKYLQSTTTKSRESSSQTSTNNPSIVIVRISPLCQTNISQSQTGLLLDFAIRDSVEEEKKWSAFQHKLKQIYSSIVVCSMLPNCQLKINLFVVMAGQDIQAAIVNAVYIGLVKMGIPLHYCTYCYTYKDPTQKNKNTNTILLSITNNSALKSKYQVIYGKYRESLQQRQQQFKSQIESFKRIMIQAINEEIR